MLIISNRQIQKYIPMQSEGSFFSLCNFSFLSCIEEETQSPQYQVYNYRPSQRLVNYEKNSNSKKKLSTFNSLNSQKNPISQTNRRHTFGNFQNNRISLKDKKRVYTEKIIKNCETSKNIEYKNTNYTSTKQSRTFHNSMPIYYQPSSALKYLQFHPSPIPRRISQTYEIYQRPKLNRFKSIQKNPQIPSSKELQLQRIQSINSYTHNSQKNKQKQAQKQQLKVPQQNNRKRRNTDISLISKSIDDLDIRQTISQKDSQQDEDKMSQIHQDDLAEFNQLFSLKRLQLQQTNKQQPFQGNNSIQKTLPVLSKKKISLKRRDTNAI